MTIILDTCEKDIIVSTEIDDIIFTSSPLDITYDEQERIKHKLILESFRYHYNNNEDYKFFCNTQGIDENISSLDDIPVFPTSMFKYAKICTADESDIEDWFTSSGTSGVKSHIARDRVSIERLLGSVNYGMKYLGSFHENQLELVNMGPDRFNAKNVWFKYVMSLVELLYPTTFTVNNDEIDFELTIKSLKEIYNKGKGICLIGPPYFIYLLCQYMKDNDIEFNAGNRIFIITGGGWKTKQKQALNRQDFNQLLMDTFHLAHESQIRDTFNQVELNTCFFEDNRQRKHVPPWVYARALDPVTLKPVEDGQEGLISYMDASSTSYPTFIVTDDIGIIHTIKAPDPLQGTTIDIVRRLNTREQKGCSLSMSSGLK
ncbi:long-chain fatty acid--CoA ligase [Photobacterium phosphoreum]|jgi:long-chain-fatty-acid---luciferin-component ligase|uniref:long-chain-fatty-acid--protein ligase LuxE n=1 Tax=Photobacterium phosphoreum TaxID=659 RepID=UPI0007F8D0D9|nr:long-chain fatty acid--CoA ligase [Photobacterium phosphoreum]MCD9475383.1 long-chain fatty acid--CoA ligase [Photobacterium phosphoreum]MCD9478955.1 long-chain fatty acid--CoA ligase [Photobacterium phosphoreum]MCD9484105.1 long-chain fatty acid--CoA ligase [Photobacterium phosphoreum]MCF2176153.1 long-chain fatty acid--CoA ligase [Photobacterium phosphoreum]OBU28531.1 long-chain fatty acid--CoA ligase [Photobacterium phosphoreum]